MELPIISFIQARLAEADPSFDTRQGSAHYDLFVIPQQFMVQPLSDFMIQRRVAQSVRQILLQPSPDSWDTTDVDDLMGNLYVTRDAGSITSGTVRVYYITPKDVEFPANTAQFTASTLNYFNSADVTITAAGMTLQSDGSLYYLDFPIVAEAAGDAYNVDAGGVTAFLNDPDAVRVTNLAKLTGGLPAESNTTVLNRGKDSIGVRDLETVKGITAILNDLFPFLQEIVSIGMGDPEMQRDILYNTHVGAKTDVYLKTLNLTAGSFVTPGLTIDSTREVSRNLHKMVARNSADPVYPPNTGTPSIVNNSTIIKDDLVETAGSILSVAPTNMDGVSWDLSATDYLRIQVDSLAPVQMKVSGATPAVTERFEIINSINAAIGLEVAVAGPGNKILLISPTVGAGSQVVLLALVSPITGTRNACNALFGVSIGSLPYTAVGVVAATYVETVDFLVDTTNGLIYQNTYSAIVRDPLSTGRQTILCGQKMLDTVATGQVTQTGSVYYLQDSVSSRYLNDPMIHVRVGDQVTIISSSTPIGITLPATFTVSEVTTTQKLRLSGFNPTSTTAANAVTYTIVSQQVVNVTYKYNPISVDIGAYTVLADGITRGIRPGRASYTITDTPLVRVTSIQQVDPDTLEAIGSPLAQPMGYGAGGYGQGGYGVGLGGDYNLIVNSPPERFSVFEDSFIVFNENALSNVYQISYQHNPELQAIHQVTRNDKERVTGADVLVKSFIPCFVSMQVGIRRDPANISTPSDAELAIMVGDLVNATVADTGLKASAIEALLVGQGVSSVQTPFTMMGVVHNPDGSTAILQSTDVLTIPAVTLPSQTDNFTTARICHFWPDVITVVEVP
jgi:hypothetical protein